MAHEPNTTILDLAIAAGVHVETVRRALAGRKVQARTVERLRPHLAAVGLTLPASAAPRPAGSLPTGQPLGGSYVRRKFWKLRATVEGERPVSLGNKPITARERKETEDTETELRAAAVWLERPRTRAECPPDDEPCPWVGCRHHLAIDLRPAPRSAASPSAVVLVWPGRDVDEMPETCSLRVAARAAEREQSKQRREGGQLRTRGLPTLPVMSFAEVGAALNSGAEIIRRVETVALAKLRAALVAAGLAPDDQAEAAP